MATATKPVSLWRNRDYLLLWGGQAVSAVGTGVSQIAYPLLALVATASRAIRRARPLAEVRAA